MLVYLLRDPVTKRVRYVGVATNARKRLISHLCEARNGRRHRPSYRPTHCCNWIRSLLRSGQNPSIEEVEVVTKDNWAERERFWIAFYRSSGEALTNLTDGGEGTLGHTQSSEVRAKRSVSMKRACSSPEFRKRRSEQLMGHPVSEDTRRKIASRHIGRKCSDAVKEHHRRRMYERITAYISLGITAICLKCGKGFTKTQTRHKFCSKACAVTMGTRAFRQRQKLLTPVFPDVTGDVAT